MLADLSITYIMILFCFSLTLIRLASTAFGFEFGVNRQYCRLLEYVLKIGPRKRLRLDSDNSSEPQTNTPRRTYSNRRISTPDGPPVFLLDDEEDDEGLESTDSSTRGKRDFQLDDVGKLLVKGIEAIMDDQVTKRFKPEDLKTWNLLTRSYVRSPFMSSSLALLWLSGFIFRYFILFPLRVIFMLTGLAWLSISMGLVGLLPVKFRDKPYCLLTMMSFRMLACGITSRLEFHDRQFRARRGDICVANHTSPIDVVLLACDNCYSLVGQRHGGLLGSLENILSRAANHVWFDRGEMKDRRLVLERIKEHSRHKSNLPVLIFPEGTCINNSAVMMFRKGTFETFDTVCPVAIKYDQRFGDPFWNSSKQSYFQYLLLLMSSWAIKCDVWYLSPMSRKEEESATDFANRVKGEIARKGGLLDLSWDGQLKRQAPKEIWREQQQEDFANRINLE